jgi:putative transposase
MGKIIEVNERFIKDQSGEMVRGNVEETLSTIFDREADQLCNATRYEYTDARKDNRASHYNRKLDTKAGRVTLKVAKLRHTKFKKAII